MPLVASPPLHWPRIYLAVALTTLATLLLELSLTRIFSVVFYYHFAFLAISIALFGLGVGGVLSYLVAGWKSNLFTKLGWLSALNGLLVVLALALMPVPKADLTYWQLARVYFTSALPFVVAGIIVSLVISDTMERVHRVYFFDLLGAATGCLLLVPFLNFLGGPGTVLAAAALFAAAAVIWHGMVRSISGQLSGAALALALVVCLLLNTSRNFIGVKYGQNETFVQWNSFSRIALEAAHDTEPPSIVIDGDAATSIWPIDIDSLPDRDRWFVLNTATALPYVLRPRPKTLIIGPGGGPDVLHAVASRSPDITGVEINPIIATTIMREKFPQLSRGLYLRPEVHIVVEEGRSFVRRSTQKYDVMQATVVDTWAATAAGAFALSENNLYTSEAFRDYLEHLTDHGILAITRWGFEPPRESLRLISLAIDALHAMGQPRPWEHVIVMRDGDAVKAAALDTVLISRSPFTREDLLKAEESIKAMGTTALYLPNRDIPNPFTQLLRSPSPRDYERAYQFDISPATDNRPFFFYTVQPRDFWNFLTNVSRNTMDYKVNRAVPLLLGLAGISIVATLIILALPPLLLGTRLPWRKGVLGFLLYFLFIGAGYILIEVALIQKFVLFLGHPTYALTVVIFSLLVTSGLGSYFSSRILANNTRRWMQALALVALLAAALAVALSYILTPAVGLPLWIKIVITVLLIAPAGFLMGMPFPTGLKRLEEWHKPSLRWAWSLNAASSVLGSVGALVSAIYLGLLQTLLIGGALYLAALLVVARNRTEPRPLAQASSHGDFVR